MAELATKSDLLALKQELQTSIEALKNNIETVKNSVETLGLRLTVRLGVMLVVAIGALAPMLKLT